MSRISSKFRSGRKTLIGYLTVGYPDLDTTMRAVPVMEQAGCDIIELGIPFSDPIGDGPVIQDASYQALLNGVTPKICIDTAKNLRQVVEAPLVFMGYYNPILSYGIQAFCRDSAEAGVDGFIVPDLPPEESDQLRETAKGYNQDMIYLLTPASTDDRIDLVASRTTAFIYTVSVAGVTGIREGVPEHLPGFIEKVRSKTSCPLAIGFGISSPSQAAAMARLADGVIIGSKLLSLIEEDRSLKRLKSFLEEVRSAIDGSDD